MKAPIFICDNGDVSIFESVEYAEQYLEPIDVLNEDFTVYDCEGMLLHPITQLMETKNVECVKITESTDSRKTPEDLKRQIVDFFIRTKTPYDESLPLPNLVDSFIRVFGYTR